MKTSIKLFLLSTLLVFSAQATTITGISGSGLWGSASSWVNGVVPTSSDDVIINGTITVNGNYTCNSLTINSSKSLTVNSGFTLTVNTQTINWSALAYGVNNKGNITLQSGGTSRLAITLPQNQNWNAFTNTSTGVFNANDGTLSINNSCKVAISNAGTFNTGTGTVELFGLGGISGTVTFYKVIIDNVAQMDFGSGSTITNTVRLNNGAYITGHPTYGSNATLEFNTNFNANGNDYSWTKGNGSDVPPNISVISGTVTLSQYTDRYIKKSLSVSSGATLDLSTACLSLPPTFTSINNNGTLTLGGMDVLSGTTWNINNNYTISTLQIENGGTVNANSYTLTMNGARNNCNKVAGIMELVSGGTFNAGTSTVKFIPPYWINVTGSPTFNNVVVQGSNTINVPTANVITITGNLAINSGATVNNPGYIIFPNGASVTTDGSQSGIPVPSTVPSAPSGNSGGGTVNTSSWLLPNSTTYTVTSDMTFTGSPKIVTISQGAKLIVGNHTITCDSVYIYGTLSVDNLSGMASTFGSAKILVGNSSTISFNANSGSQTITPRTDYANIELTGNGAKNFSASNYGLTGNFIVSGATPTFNDNTIIDFKGTSQNISCKSFKSVTFSNSGNKVLLDTTKISGLVTVSGSANLVSNGYLTLQSTASGTASIGALSGSATVTGNVNYERYIPAGRLWRFIGWPINGNTFANSWQNSIYITGAGTGGSLGTTNSNGFDYAPANPTGVYTYNETLTGASSARWTAVTNTSTSINPTKGYRLFIRGDRAQGTTLLNGSAYTPQAVTLRGTGTISKGDIAVSLTCSNGCTSNDGWHLLSNPYPSAIDWNNASWVSARSNVGTTIYIYNPNQNRYGAWSPLAGAVNGGNNAIASGQSFYVKTNGATTLTFKEDYKVNNPTVGLFGKTDVLVNNLKMQLGDSVNVFDETVVFMYKNATNDFDTDIDAIKPDAGNASISTYTSANTTKLVFNGIPELPTNAIDTILIYMPLGNATYTYNLSFIGVSTFTDLTTQFTLIDAYTGNSTIITDASSVYSFATTSGVAASYANNRFKLIIGTGTNGALPVHFAYFNAKKVSSKGLLKWATANEVNNDKFEIERSVDGLNYINIGSVKGLSNSSKIVEYTFTDENPSKGINYYRLKQIDLDGTSTLSTIVTLNFAGIAKAEISLFPVPADDYVSINFNNYNTTSAVVTIFDMVGKTMYTENVSVSETNYVHPIALSQFKTGIYFVEIKQADGKIDKIKFIKE